MMRVTIRAAVLCAAFLIAQPLPAQQSQPDPQSSDVVVTGHRDLERTARSFVSALTPGFPTDQLPRFETAICPAALGLSRAHGEAVERRLRRVAAAAGMQVAPEGCVVNVLLMVVDRDTRDVIQTLRRRHVRYLGNLTPSQIRRLARGLGPTASWQQTGLVTGRGSVVTDPGGGALAGFNFTTENPSRIMAPARPIFEASALVVERRALAGITATQLADYAAMRLFARLEPTRLADSSVPTILNVLDAPMGSEVPVTLTDWDMGFLRGLYTSTPNLYAGAQRSEIARAIVERLGRTEGAPD